ncbi:uncharacterized protein LOC131672530 [Phymastichus coffea]|uniref:uncharacterized protein LOC131672530 n=1 Tax=Phymastichus coffea TaxID=108790 RepID=UPI00273B5F3D|nr:uncharacterized protein LOC131672530 [Phymastichus coffea]
MMGRCCVASCRNSGSECDEAAALFGVPIEADQRGRWLAAVGPSARSFNSISLICERHFREDQIERQPVVRDSFGNVTFQGALVKLSLAKDAVPSIFCERTEVTTDKKRKAPPLEQPNNANAVGSSDEGNPGAKCSNIVVSFHENQTSSIQYVINGSQALPAHANSTGHVTAVSNTAVVDKQLVLQRIPDPDRSNAQMGQEVTVATPKDEVLYLSQVKNNNCPPQKKIKRSKRSTFQTPLQQSEKDMNLRSFDQIYQNSDKIKLPNSMWGYHKNDKDNNIMVFSKIKWFSTNACTLPLYERQVIFHESSELKIYINNTFSPLETPRPRDIAEMEQVLLDVDRLSLCSGGPSIEFAQTAALAQKDHAVGRWRHKYCPIIVANYENICKYCSSINQVFRYPKQKRMPFGKRALRAQKQQAKDCS